MSSHLSREAKQGDGRARADRNERLLRVGFDAGWRLARAYPERNSYEAETSQKNASQNRWIDEMRRMGGLLE